MGRERERDRCFRGAEGKLEAWRQEGEPEATREEPREKRGGVGGGGLAGPERRTKRKGEGLGEPEREGQRPEGGPQAKGEPPIGK